MGWIGKNGSRMFREAETQGLPPPEIIEIGMRLRFSIQLARSIPFERIVKQVGAQSGAQSDSILLLLVDSPLSSSELADALGLEAKTGAFKRALKALVDQGLIAYTLPDKPTIRLQKYRLTEKGKAFLDYGGGDHGK